MFSCFSDVFVMRCWWLCFTKVLIFPGKRVFSEEGPNQVVRICCFVLGLCFICFDVFLMFLEVCFFMFVFMFVSCFVDVR